MKYRVRLDLSFASESDAQTLMACARGLSGQAVSINEGQPNEEIPRLDFHKCYHDESVPKPCEVIEELRIKKLKE